ncbi:Uncharacterised protein [Serratia plymuthica]|uniref:hypothetical protein n=1 Tax=Serratia plymuthica TaxID=82996 RepID=UPI00217A0B94|nr:hypothetical protein [Serratia plymuthica]CAI0731385.1 Uncharacterised protein [Serratia plymuthica]
MKERTEKGELIIGKINDPLLMPGMNRIRSGSTQQFGNDWNKPDLTLTPPERHFYALEINGVWMWVNGCAHCNQNGEKMSYVACDEHDRCQCCGLKKEDAIATPGGGFFGSRDANDVWGWTCHPCHEQQESERRLAALARIAPDDDYSEMDFWHEDNAKCPWCSAELCTDESYDADAEQCSCDECGNSFTLTAEHSVSWTTKRVGGSDASK